MKKMSKRFEAQMQNMKQFLIDNPTNSAGIFYLADDETMGITVYYGEEHPKAIAGRKEEQ